MARSRKIFLFALALLATLGIVVSTHVGTTHGFTTASITTDQKFYSVGQQMIVSGTGFSPTVLIALTVERPDHQIDTIPGVTTDSSGAFTAPPYNPPLESGRYKFTATDGANSANTASTEADAVSYNKGVYNKGAFTPEDITGNWTTGNAGKNYEENQWVFYQYQSAGIPAFSGGCSGVSEANCGVPSFDVQFNHFDPPGNAMFVDAFADFRVCIDCTDGTTGTGSQNPGMLDNADPVPSENTTTSWLLAVEAGSAISHINRPMNTAADGSGTTVLTGSGGFCSSDNKEPVPNGTTTFPAAVHCFHVSGPKLAAMFATPLGAGTTHTITLFYAAHLAASYVWGNQSGVVGGHQGSLGDCTTAYYAKPLIHGTPTLGASFEPTTGGCGGGIPNYGTDDYAGWTTTAIGGAGFTKGSSPHFNIANQTAGSNGAIDLPIPTVAAPNNTLIIKKVTVPSNATGVTFNYTSPEVGPFSLTSPFPSSHSFTGIAPGVEYDVTESGLAGWNLTSSTCAVTSGMDDGTGTIPGTTTNPMVGVTFGFTDSGVTITCTYTNTQTATLIVKKATTPSGAPDSFPFTTTGTGYSSFSLTDGTQNSQTLVPGSYSVAESAVTGWALTSRSCVSSLGTSTVPPTSNTSLANITLAAGDTVTCTYNNDKPDLKITLTPPTANNEIGTPHTFTATVQQNTTGTFANVPDGTLVTFSLPGSPAGVSFVSGTNTCTTVAGSCSVSVTSTAVTTATINASVSLTVLGVSLSRTTGDGLSGDSPNSTKNWVDANITITPQVATNLVGNSHVFTITVTAIPGSVTPVQFTSITPSFVGTPPGTQSNTCATPNITGNVATCTLTINSTTPGTFTAHAAAVVTIGGVALNRATGDAKTGDSPNAIKHYVDANITITPSATNAVGQAHTFTVTVTQLPDDATPATSANVTYNITPTPSGAVLTTNTSTCGPTVAFSGNVATCTITINTATGGTSFVAHAQAVINFPGGGPTGVTVATGDSHTGDGPDATKKYVDANITITPSATNEVGHAHTFTITLTAIPGTVTPVTFGTILPTLNTTVGLTSNTNTCAAPTIVANVATCTLTINSATGGGSYTANASGSVTMGTVTVSRATGDSNAGDGPAAVKKYVDGNITITPTAVNEVNHSHVFTITATQIPGTATPAATANITPNVNPTPGSYATTCGTAVPFSGGGGTTASCTVTINSATAGQFTANATGVFTVGGVVLTRMTGDGKAGDSAAATKTYVDANISLTPLTANNQVGQVHTITATVMQNDGLATGGDGVNGFGPAPNGTLVTFSLLNNTATPPIAFVGGVNTCTTTAGICTVQINSSVPGSVDIHATTTFTVNTVSLTRASGDGLSGDSANAHKNYVAGTFIVRKVTLPAGGTGFGFTTTGSLTPATFSLNDGQNHTYNNLPAGTYTATETDPTPAYDLTNVACTASGTGTSYMITGSTVSAILGTAGGGVVDCTYTNQKRGAIVVDKTTIGSTGSFTYTATGNGLSGFGLTTTTAGVASTPQTFSNLQTGTLGGSRTITESGPGTGFQFTSLVCSSALGTSTFTPTTVQSATQVATITTLGAGDTVTCHYVNTGEGTIIVRKQTVGGSGAFSWTGTNDLTGFTSGTVSPDGNFHVVHTYSNLPTGTTGGSRTITETNPGAAWALTGSVCNSLSGLSSITGTTITTLAPGDTVTCDFTNTKQANLIVTKTTVGGAGAFSYTGSTSFTLTTTSAGSGGAASTNATTVPSFSNIAPGSIKTVSETAKTGWVLDGAPICSITTSGSGTSSATISATGAQVTLGAGDTVTCSFTNDLLPTLTIIKHATGASQTFGYTVTGGGSVLNGSSLTPPANGSATTGTVSINPGPSSVSENTPLPTGWTLTDSSCTGASGTTTGSNPEAGSGADFTWSFTANYGDNVVCNYTNSVVILTTRTQGFWATHTGLSNAVWNGGTLPPGFPAGGSVINPADPSPVGSPDAYLCGVQITAVPQTEENVLLGGFWANIAQMSGKGGKRTSIDQARMQMLQQYLAAVLNVHMFGSGSPGLLSTARAAYCSANETAIKNQVGILGTFNQSGDNQNFDPGTSATAQLSKAQADIDAWDKPQFPGLSDEDGLAAPKLALVKNLNQGLTGTAATTDFTLSAACTAGNCVTPTNLSGGGGVASTTVTEGTYTLSEAADAAGAGYSPGSWTCTGSGSFAVSATTAGTAQLGLGQGAVVSCSITNTHP